MRQLVFSGDLGNPATVLMPDPSPVKTAELVLMESTYGDRNHQSLQNTLEEFANALEEAHKAGGNVFIPAFALGRSQEIVYYLGLLYHQGRLKQKMVVLDSPMAIEITKIYNELMAEFDRKDTKVLQGYGARDLQSFLPILRLASSMEESMALNRVKLFGQNIAVKAIVHTLGGFSAHAGQDELVGWARMIGGQPRFYLVHGEPKAQQALQSRMIDYGLHCQIAEKGQQIKL